MLDHECSICAGIKFKPYGSRKLGKCIGCGALERTRTIFSIFKKLDMLTPGKKILHIAPESSLIDPFFKAFGSGYTVADVRKEALDQLPGDIEKLVFDMTDIKPELAARKFDIVLHSHILEHLRGSWQLAYLRMDSLISPGGHHVFAVPLLRDWTYCDLSEMARVRRKSKFGQYDHMRFIGRRDFENDMAAIEDLAKPEFFRAASEILSTAELERIAGDPDVFVMKKAPPVGRLPRVLAAIRG